MNPTKGLHRVETPKRARALPPSRGEVAPCPTCAKYALVELIRKYGECTTCLHRTNSTPMAKARAKAEAAKEAKRIAVSRRTEATRAKRRAKRAADTKARLKISCEGAKAMAVKHPDMSVEEFIRATGCSLYFAKCALGHVDPSVVPGQRSKGPGKSSTPRMTGTGRGRGRAKG